MKQMEEGALSKVNDVVCGRISVQSNNAQITTEATELDAPSSQLPQAQHAQHQELPHKNDGVAHGVHEHPAIWERTCFRGDGIASHAGYSSTSHTTMAQLLARP